jgi:hypothetical protein
MVDGIVFLISVIVAAVCGAVWGLWQGEKSNTRLKQKNKALNQALESERLANESLRKWLKFYRERENNRN